MGKLVILAFLILSMQTYANTNDPNFDPNIAMADRYSIEENPEYIEFEVELTYYTDTAHCNGIYAGMTASGVPLNPMTVAVPRELDSNRPIIPYGTSIEIDGLGSKLVQDTGHRDYIKVKEDGVVIIDVFIPRLHNETDRDYLSRVFRMGRTMTKARVYLEEGKYVE